MKLAAAVVLLAVALLAPGTGCSKPIHEASADRPAELAAATAVTTATPVDRTAAPAAGDLAIMD
jgi:hypothetical protein